MSLDVRILEVLVSRICHDLISPISAVSNGAELVSDMGGVMSGADDAFDLIRASAASASIKLQTFRLAYGAGGSEWHVSMDDVEKTFGDYIALEHRYSLEWALVGNRLPKPMPRGFPKLAMLALMWAMETLPRGGVIKIYNDVDHVDDSSPVVVTITAQGQGAAMREGMMDAFAGKMPSENLTPKTVHAAAMAYYAKAYGINVEADAKDTDIVRFVITYTP